MNEVYKPFYLQQIPGISLEEKIVEIDSFMRYKHFHNTVEINILLEGERYYFIEQDIYHIKQGMAIIIDQKKLHKSGMITGNMAYHSILLYLDVSTLDKYFSLPEVHNVKEFGNKYGGIVEFSSEDWQKLLLIIDMMKYELMQNTAEGNAMGFLSAMQLITLIARNRKDNAISLLGGQRLPHSNVCQRVQEIILYIDNHATEDFTLDELAAHFHISTTYLTRIFRSVTNFSVTEYRTLCRIRKAKQLLSNTSLSITEITFQLGFGNITYFERVFKRITDLTPLQYRKQKLSEPSHE